MSLRSRIAARWPKDIPLQIIPKEDWANQQPTFQDAQPRLIESALHRAEQRPSGNWYVFAASTDVRTDEPFGIQVISPDAFSVDGIRRFEEMGVTDVIVGFRWPYTVGPDDQPLQEKIDHLRRYADGIMAACRD